MTEKPGKKSGPDSFRGFCLVAREDKCIVVDRGSAFSGPSTMQMQRSRFFKAMPFVPGSKRRRRAAPRGLSGYA